MTPQNATLTSYIDGELFETNNNEEVGHIIFKLMILFVLICQKTYLSILRIILDSLYT